MSREAAIVIEGLSKRYRLGERQRYYALRDVLTRALAAPWRALTRAAGGTKAGDRSADDLWALKDVSVDIERGDVVGIIGRNGAGKSTLLKILSRITEPTGGTARIFGRVSSLLEVGTGFHPELTGRENVLLNGAILGMRKREIRGKFDEIVAFAEVEKFIDTPVKHYSSGMHVRLAFAVAAHMEPEIMLVDEVLAVGDAAFQKKCLGKMSDVAQAGRTVLFVSHNMGAVARLCTRGLWLHEGCLLAAGPVDQVVDRYTESLMGSDGDVAYAEVETKPSQVVRAQLLDAEGDISVQLDRMRPFRVVIDYVVRQRLPGAHLTVMLDRADGTPVCHSVDSDAVPGGVIDRDPNRYRAVVEFPGGILNAGLYQIRIGIARYAGSAYDYCEPFVFHLIDAGTFASLGAGGRQRTGILAIPLVWASEPVGAVETAP